MIQNSDANWTYQYPRVIRMISCGWIISHRCSWIMVYVLCCNAQINLIVIFMICTCIVMHSLFCQLPNCNLFTQHVISLWRDISSELWTPVHSFTFILPSTAKHCLLFANIILLHRKQTSLSTLYV
jgi:hypothetical protein